MKLKYYPDPILAQPCHPVVEFNDALKHFIDEMKKTMVSLNGLGLSANQVGVSKQLFVMKDNKENIIELINPKILSVDGMVPFKEGCLSAPNIYLTVHRPESVVVQYQDINGEEKRIVSQGLEARIIQHEMEHLAGDFYFNRVNRVTRKIAIANLRKQKLPQ